MTDPSSPPSGGTAIRTRVATLIDVPELARLNVAFNDVREPPERLARRMASPQRVETAILAEIAGQTVGFASLRLVPLLFADEVMAELSELYVDPAYRRQGAGLALIRHAERLAREAGARELYLVTGFENAVGQAFYRAAGYHDAELVMSRPLESHV